MYRIMLLIVLVGFSSLTSMERMQIDEQNPKKRELEYRSESAPKRQATEDIKHIQKLASLPPGDQLSYFSQLLMKAPKFDFWDAQGRLQMPPETIQMKYEDDWNTLLDVFLARIHQVPLDLKQGYAAFALQDESSFGQPSLVGLYANASLDNIFNQPEEALQENLEILVNHATEQQKFNALYFTLLSQLDLDDEDKENISMDTAIEHAKEVLGYLFDAGIDPTVKNRVGYPITHYLTDFELTDDQISDLATFIARHAR